MANIIAGIGDLVTSNNPQDVLKTFALGSCVAVIVKDPVNIITGLVHIALPDAATNYEKAEKQPGYFADTGISALLSKMKIKGMKLRGHRLMVKLVGGATMYQENGVFNIGKRNILAVKKMLWKYGMGPISEDLEGEISRTVSVSVESGKVTITSTKRKILEI